MLPSSGRESRSNRYSAQRSGSDKQEIARAALRSLASPTSNSTTQSDPPLPPGPSLVTQLPPLHSSRPSSTGANAGSSTRHASDLGAVDDRRFGYEDAAAARRSSRDVERNLASSSTANDLAAIMSRGSSSSSFFRDQSITASPDSSPRLAPTHLATGLSAPNARHTLTSMTSPGEIHELALRRASLALGVNIEDVRQIVHAYARGGPSTSSSVSVSNQGYRGGSQRADNESAFVTQVLDAYYFESDRASQSQPSYERRDVARAPFGSHSEARPAAPSGSTWNPSDRFVSQQRHLLPHRSGYDGLDDRTRERSALHPASYDARRHASTSTGPSHAVTSPINEPRAESPSPFAYDAHRRPSHPIMDDSRHSGRIPTQARSRASYGYPDESAHSRDIDEERATARTRYGDPPHAYHAQMPQSSMYERRVRSIDDYLEQQQQHQQQLQSRQRRGSIAYYPGRANAATTEYEDDRIAERHFRAGVRHSYQPYPSASSRHAAGLPAANHTAQPPSQSPQLSPTTGEFGRFQQFSQRRSPLLRSPAAETVASSVSSSVPSVAALSPSPLLGAAGHSSNRLMPEDRSEAEGKSELRSVSEDSTAEHTRAGVARMQIDDSSSSKGQKVALRKSRSSRSSFSSVDRGSGTIAGTDLSHSEIMQKLQDKVKSRLAAKGKLVPSSPQPNANQARKDQSKGSSSSVKLKKVARANSVKRSATSIAGSSESPRPAAASPEVSTRTSGSSSANAIQKSATPSDDMPAPKVRRTSASPPKPSPNPSSKAASPAAASRNSNSTPTSIEAALLSPTDTPTPSEAAAAHAERLSRSPRPPEGMNTVETASGQALPGDLPGAGQMQAASATKQQTSKSGADSLIQSAQSDDPTESTSAIA